MAPIRVAPAVTTRGVTEIDLSGISYELKFKDTGDGRFIDLVFNTHILGSTHEETPGEPLTLHLGRDFLKKMRDALQDVPKAEPWEPLHGGI